MDWTNKFFGEYYLKTHLPVLSDERTALETAFITEVLNLEKGASLLDVPCGHGRHAKELAKLGFNVTAVDMQADFITMAKEESEDITNIEFITQDMREIAFEKQFDAVINMFTSFGYFSEKQNFEFLIKMAKALKPGGKLVMDMVNREWALNQSGQSDQAWLVYPPDNMTFLANNRFDLLSSRMISDQLIIENGVKHEMHQDIRLYTFTEMNFLLSQIGMDITECYGNFYKDEYNMESTNMILVAVRAS